MKVLYLLVGSGLHPDCRFLVGLWVLLTALGLRMFNEGFIPFGWLWSPS